MKQVIDINNTDTWTRYRAGLCDSCVANCCRMPVEATLDDLVRMEVLDAFELQEPLKRIARKLKHFSRHVETELLNYDDKPYSTVEINCPDQPGILASIGKIFAEHNIQLLNARIATLGERVEDMFFIVDAHNQKIIDPGQIERLQNDIRQELGN